MPRNLISQVIGDKILILGRNFNSMDSAYRRTVAIQQFYLFTIAGYFNILRIGDVQIYFSFIFELFFLSCRNKP